MELQGTVKKIGETQTFAKLNQDGSWSKMYQDCCLLTLGGSLLEYSETWPQAGMMRNGISYRLPGLAHRTSEKGSLLWPTPVRSDAVGGRCYQKPPGREGGFALKEITPGALNPTWVEWLMGFPPGWTDLEHSETR